MKRLILSLVTLLTTHAWAVYEVGDKVENLCWTDVNNAKICLEDSADTVRVLVHNAGWCGPCNQEVGELSQRVQEFEGSPVVFYSLSASGWTQGSLPDEAFLKSWQEKHQIPFIVAASPKDAGKKFFTPPMYIPNVVVLDKEQKVAFKGVAPGVDATFAEIKKLLR